MVKRKFKTSTNGDVSSNVSTSVNLITSANERKQMKN